MRGKWLKSAFTIIMIIALFTCIATTNGETRRTTLIETFFSNLVALPQKGYAYVKEFFAGNDTFFITIDELKEENKSLKKELKELEEKAIAYEEVFAENEVLKSHISLNGEYPDYSMVVADIISDSATNWEATYIINKGSTSGVLPGMAVICKDGLVGYVETTTSNTSKIISILDAGNSVSARVTRTRDEVVCKGTVSLATNQELKIINIPANMVLVEGDKLETSGIGGIYPKGIGIGKVTEVINKSNPLENEAIIKTYVDFNKLETVGVIIQKEVEEMQ